MSGAFMQGSGLRPDPDDFADSRGLILARQREILARLREIGDQVRPPAKPPAKPAGSRSAEAIVTEVLQATAYREICDLRRRCERLEEAVQEALGRPLNLSLH